MMELLFTFKLQRIIELFCLTPTRPLHCTFHKIHFTLWFSTNGYVIHDSPKVNFIAMQKLVWFLNELKKKFIKNARNVITHTIRVGMNKNYIRITKKFSFPRLIRIVFVYFFYNQKSPMLTFNVLHNEG